jgi:hypothetical protein
MPITFSANYLAEIKKLKNIPDIIVLIELDSGDKKFGIHNHYVDVNCALSNPSSFQNKIEPEKGYSTLGKLSFAIIGRENFKSLIRDDYLKNRRVTKYEGFVADGFDFSDYAKTYTGIISNWTREGDKLTISVADDMQPTTKSAPEENDTKTQYLDYSATNPVDIMTDLIITQAPVPSGRVDSSQFASERDLWLSGWKFQRILVDPEKIKDLLNELQESTNSFIVHDGELITYKVFSPLIPGQTVLEIRDRYEILNNSVKQDSGYLERFYNRIVVYFDYDESGDDKDENFDSVYDVTDVDSQDSSQWDEVTTKRIYSKWIKSFTFDQPSNITGLVVYHVSKSNGLTAGKVGHEIKWNSTNKTLTWTAPDGTEGSTITVDTEGRFNLFDADTGKFIRVIVTDFSSLPGTDSITITALSGSNYAAAIANKWSTRYRDPVATVDYSLDLNHISNKGDMWKPTDSFTLTTDDAAVKGKDSLNAEPMMILGVRPDGGANKLKFTAIQTKISKRYGFIGAASITSDYPAATEAEREYAFIGDSNNKVNAGTEDGYYIW